MPKGICDKTSNNKYFNCPPRMDDARHFTDYRSSDYVNNLIRMSYGIVGSYEYRQYLINNADKLMQMNRDYAYEKNGCSPCNFKPVPFKTDCDVTIKNVACKTANPNGIGIKYHSGM